MPDTPAVGTPTGAYLTRYIDKFSSRTLGLKTALGAAEDRHLVAAVLS